MIVPLHITGTTEHFDKIQNNIRRSITYIENLF